MDNAEKLKKTYKQWRITRSVLEVKKPFVVKKGRGQNKVTTDQAIGRDPHRADQRLRKF